jgi:hypothetical protein
MTARLKGLIVTLDHDIREDDIEPIVQAIRLIRCVASVAGIESNSEDHMARQRVRSELAEGINEVALDLFQNGGQGLKELKRLRELRRRP